MSYFLSSNKLALKKLVIINGQEARHILLARRVKVGEHITLQDPTEQRFNCQVKAIKKNELEVLVLTKAITPAEPKTPVTLLQAAIAEQALDIVLQKATELGVSEICIFIADFSPNSPKDPLKKLERWRKIVQEATKQSERLRPPIISLSASLENALGHHSKAHILYCHPHADTSEEIRIPHTSTVIIIGPEGGFSEKELSLVKAQKNSFPLNLGPRILRSETAAITSLAIIQYLNKNL